MGVVYYLASSQPDRVNFDRDVESWLSDIWDSLDLDVQGDYRDNPHDFVSDQWEQEGNGYTEDEDGVEDGMIFVEDMAEAEARFKAVARKFMQSSTAKLATGITVDDCAEDGLIPHNLVRSLELSIPAPAVGINQTYRVAQGRLYTAPKAKQYKQVVSWSSRRR